MPTACLLSLALERLPRRAATDRSGGPATAEEDGVFTGEAIKVPSIFLEVHVMEATVKGAHLRRGMNQV